MYSYVEYLWIVKYCKKQFTQFQFVFLQAMRLKRLDIKGFKSFANDTVIHFNEDVVGIVGPNGSGKSNIVDAIRWVLGEQKSKELRLDQMTSVIFNGTKTKKQSGLAQVTLTFENTKNLLPIEYNSVSISRMLYRTGESEYRLNSIPCRLKDITTLFLDTGIGSNSYAIIALGMVDDILSDKENARRKMFEQAAGISKYKARKRETLQKLQSTVEDLERVQDLLHEISSQLNTLEKQAKRARRFFEIKDQYKQHSLELTLIKIADLKSKHHKIKQQLEQQEDNYRGLEITTRQLEATIEAEKKANLDNERLLSDRQRELNRLVGNIKGMENDRKIIDQRLTFIQQNQKQLVQQLEKARTTIDQLEEETIYYRTELNSEKRLEATLEAQLDAAEKHLKANQTSHADLKGSRDELLNRQQQANQGIFELEKQKAIHSNQIASKQQEIEQQQKQIEQRARQIDDLKVQLQQLETQEKLQLQQLKTLEFAKEQRQFELQKLTHQLEEIRSEQAKVNRTLDAKKNELQLTKSMIDNFEGFPESIQFLSNKKNWNAAAPLLSDIIYVKEAYRVAIENYLESYLNYYVVENREEAIAAIRLLSNAQKGKANFFLLDTFEQYISPITLQVNAQKAVDLIEVDSKYLSLCSYLLENVVVVDDDQQMEKIPSDELTVLAKSGRLISKKHSLSGGSIGLFEGKKIGRKKNLEILETEIKQLERQADRLASTFYTCQAQLDTVRNQKTEQEIQTANQTLNQILQKKAGLVSTLDNFESFFQNMQTNIAEANKTIETLLINNQHIEQQLAKKQQQAQAVQDEIAAATDSFKTIAERLNYASTQFNEQNIAYIKQQNKVNQYQQELAFREKQLQELRTNFQQYHTDAAKADDEIKLLLEEGETLNNKLSESYKIKKEQSNSLSAFEQTYFAAREKINDIEKQLRQQSKALQDSQNAIGKSKDQFNEVKYEISAVAQRVRIEFDMDINELINSSPKVEAQNIEELQLKVERLKSRIDTYGEINPMAVEAYDAMKERHDSIAQQRDDIVKAKSDLEETIKEIEETATNKFLQSFEEVRIYFIDVFRSLFTEDDVCDLILTQPDDPLQSNIEIIAKPKGKRPQTINQLSGGEKTLTATALLFALYLLKPAPFCIFDEVDAPLDDANIEKFNNIIRKFSKDSQFIIVTHNKLTMAAVDVIYGVHNEQGISNVLPVNFSSFEHKTVMEAIEESKDFLAN